MKTKFRIQVRNLNIAGGSRELNIRFSRYRQFPHRPAAPGAPMAHKSFSQDKAVAALIHFYFIVFVIIRIGHNNFYLILIAFLHDTVATNGFYSNFFYIFKRLFDFALLSKGLDREQAKQ